MRNKIKRSASQTAVFAVAFIILMLFALTYILAYLWGMMAACKTHSDLILHPFELPQKWKQRVEEVAEEAVKKRTVELMSEGGTGTGTEDLVLEHQSGAQPGTDGKVQDPAGVQRICVPDQEICGQGNSDRGNGGQGCDGVHRGRDPCGLPERSESGGDRHVDLRV